MSAPAVSVIIPVRNDLRVLAAVASVRACTFDGPEPQIVVVDNGSSAATHAAIAHGLQGHATFLGEPEPGVYRARNRGLAAATGDAIFFTDADCVVRPGWLAAGIAALQGGADIVQGYSGSVTRGRIARLLQARYEAHLRRLRPGDSTECDTRNLLVRRTVFDALRFEERFRRVGDTEFGLRAEAAGFTVAYAPDMRVDHEHEPDLPLFAAKQACHGWGAQRLMVDYPDVRWHGGHLKAVARVSRSVSRRPGARLLATGITRLAIWNGWLLQRLASRLPFGLALAWLTAVDKLAALGGHLSYVPGAPEPSPSGLLRRPLPRD